MRLTFMNRLVLSAAAALLFSFPASPARAQVSVPPGQGSAFRDTSALKLPAGAKVAIFEFEDLECPACAHAYPIVHGAVEHYKIPLIRHDFPLKMHQWSMDAAVTARYLQDKVSPQVAEQFRHDVFAAQTSIASKDDLANYTRKWFAAHNQKVPFVMDPAGLFTAEVNADYTLGERIGLVETPTIFVLTQRGWIQMKDINQLYATLDTALADAASSKPAAKSGVRRAPTPQR